MMENLKQFFSSQSFMPHGHCYLWRPDILWLNVGSDAAIAFAYYVIPLFLIYLVKTRQDLAFNWIFVMFALFIVACGTTHLVEIWTVWNPQYGIQGLAKLLTAGVSVATALALVPLMPKALALPSPKQLEEANQKLRREVDERNRAEAKLREVYEDLERRIAERTADLQRTNETMKASEAAVAMQAERLRSVVDHVVDGIITINTHFQIESWNPAAKRIFGYEAKEVIGRNVNMLMPEPYHGQHDAYVASYVNTGKAKIIGIGREVVGQRKDGSTFPMDLAVSEFSIGEERLFTGIVRDITERKRAEESLRRAADELRAAKEAAEAANHAKSAFLANMSHEIRTPLGAVLGFSELLLSPEVTSSEKLNYFAAIQRNGELLSTIINDILDLSKVEAGKMEVETRDVALTEVLTDLTTMLHLQAAEKGIRLTVTAEASAPAIIRTDALRLRQILINIVGNAVKFTEKGAVEVTIKMQTEAGQDRLVFVVKDTGRGIAREQAERLFEPFSQADPSTKRKFGGTGLGLALSKRLAKVLGGDIALVDSGEGRGSTFQIAIDPGPVALLSLPSSRLTDDAPVSRPTESLSLAGFDVLLADDAPDNQLLVSRMLKMAGARVDTASNGREALAMSKNKRYDVLLMDLQMPIMDGYEATAELRRQGLEAPIIALTAHALQEERQRCLASGFSDHVSKPVNRVELLRSIVRLGSRA